MRLLPRKHRQNVADGLDLTELDDIAGHDLQHNYSLLLSIKKEFSQHRIPAVSEKKPLQAKPLASQLALQVARRIMLCLGRLTVNTSLLAQNAQQWIIPLLRFCIRAASQFCTAQDNTPVVAVLKVN